MYISLMLNHWAWKFMFTLFFYFTCRWHLMWPCLFRRRQPLPPRPPLKPRRRIRGTRSDQRRGGPWKRYSADFWTPLKITRSKWRDPRKWQENQEQKRKKNFVLDTILFKYVILFMCMFFVSAFNCVAWASKTFEFISVLILHGAFQF